MSLITDRRVAETVCMHCGKIIHIEKEPFAEIDGLHTIATLDGLKVERFTGYAHVECDSVMTEYINGGVEGARERVRSDRANIESDEQQASAIADTRRERHP